MDQNRCCMCTCHEDEEHCEHDLDEDMNNGIGDIDDEDGGLEDDFEGDGENEDDNINNDRDDIQRRLVAEVTGFLCRCVLFVRCACLCTLRCA